MLDDHLLGGTSEHGCAEKLARALALLEWLGIPVEPKKVH
jgi:hypothetical protein